MAQQPRNRGFFGSLVGSIGTGIGMGFGAILGKVIEILGILAVVFGAIFWAVDYITSIAHVDTFLGTVALPKTHLLGDFVGFVINLILPPAIGLLILWVVVGILNHVPEGSDDPLWKMILKGLPHLAIRGSKHVGRVTAEQARRARDEVRRRRGEAALDYVEEPGAPETLGDEPGQFILNLPGGHRIKIRLPLTKK